MRTSLTLEGPDPWARMPVEGLIFGVAMPLELMDPELFMAALVVFLWAAYGGGSGWETPKVEDNMEEDVDLD